MKAGIIAAMFLLAGCAGSDVTAPLYEKVDYAPALLTVEGHGVLHSSKSTPLVVPGSQWSQRQLIWMKDDGSAVKEGEVVARFSAKQSELELSNALIDLQRTALARAAKEFDLGDAQGKLHVDLSQVAELLGIAHRYANVSQLAVSRDTILDAIQDEHFLNVKQDTLNWRKDNSATRGKAELALIDAQRATNELVEKAKRSDLDALELRAPHAGYLVLAADWSGQKPHVGGNLWAGNAFASLPETATMDVEIAIPQSEAAALKVGEVVELSPLGAPDQKVDSKLTWIAASSAPRNRESPVKYLSVKASVPVDAIEKYHWVPGQDFSAVIVLLKSDRALTLPNIALTSAGDTTSVQVRSNGKTQTRSVTIGARGPSRTEIVSGLKAGEEVLIDLNPAAPKSNDKRTLASSP